MTPQEEARIIAERVMGWDYDEDEDYYSIKESKDDYFIGTEAGHKAYNEYLFVCLGNEYNPHNNIEQAMKALETFCKDPKNDFYAEIIVGLLLTPYGVDIFSKYGDVIASAIDNDSLAAAITAALVEAVGGDDE